MKTQNYHLAMHALYMQFLNKRITRTQYEARLVALDTIESLK